MRRTYGIAKGAATGQRSVTLARFSASSIVVPGARTAKAPTYADTDGRSRIEFMSVEVAVFIRIGRRQRC